MLWAQRLKRGPEQSLIGLYSYGLSRLSTRLGNSRRLHDATLPESSCKASKTVEEAKSSWKYKVLNRMMSNGKDIPVVSCFNFLP
jgi:hypothetical protein